MKISENKIKKRGGVVVLPIEEYKRLLAKAVPACYLSGESAEELDKAVKNAEEEYEKGEIESMFLFEKNPD